MLKKLKQLFMHVIARLRFGTSLEAEEINFKMLSALEIGEGAHVKIGKGFSLRDSAHILVRDGASLDIGTNVFLNYGVVITCRDEITIGPETMFGPYSQVYDHDHDMRCNEFKSNFRYAPVRIGSGCWICAGSVITAGSIMGDGSIAAANSVVRGIVPDGALAAGIPAKVKRFAIGR